MKYPGGKNGNGVYQTIINLIPPHDTYIELFLGSGAIMFRKRPAKKNIAVDIDPEAINAFKMHGLNVDLYCENALSYLERSRNSIRESDFIYVDPPYLLGVRSSKRKIYRYEFETEELHRKLIQLLLILPCRIMVSGYKSDLYKTLLSEWNTHVYTTRTRSGAGAKETLWMNYDPPMTLHDYSYLGSNYRERERIKLRVNRWRTSLERLDIIERRAILSAVNELYL